MQTFEQAALDWWITKQLRGMVLTDLREFVSDDYFSREAETFSFHESLANAPHYSIEMRWGHLAGKLGHQLFFRSTTIMTARQTAAAEVLMNLGMLAAAEAAQGGAQQLSAAAKVKSISDGNAGSVAEQLRAESIPTLSANVRGALKQYLLYLTSHEAAPFLPLLESPIQKYEEHCLSDDAIHYFEQLCANDFADAWKALEMGLERFLKDEVAKGRNVGGGAGFAARASKLYEDDLVKRSQIIVTNLKQAHQDFGSPLASGIEDQLKKLGAEMLEQQLHGLETAYKRYLGRLGIAGMPLCQWDTRCALQRASIANVVNRHLWVLRRVPMKAPNQQSSQPTFVIHGNVGAIQTAPGAVAHVQQHVGERDFGLLVDALAHLRRVASSIDGIDASQRVKLIADIAAADAEINCKEKDEIALLKWLAGIGSVVQTLGSAQPAWDAVRAAAKSVGLPL